MKVPGRAWLEFRAEPDGSFTVLRQLAQFEPHGLTGILYWYVLSPIHALMFRGMLRQIAAIALQAGGGNALQSNSYDIASSASTPIHFRRTRLKEHVAIHLLKVFSNARVYVSGL